MNPPLKICDREIKIQGKLLRIARIQGDKYRFLEDPEPLIDGLKKCGERIDIFTFIQKLPEPGAVSEVKYRYPMEWDNFAALPLTTFDEWWTKTIGFKARNKAKQAEKKGIVLREVPFDDALIQGIWEIYNECPIRQGRPFSHFGEDIETVRRIEAPFLDSSVFIGAFLEGKMIGFVKLVIDETRTQAGLMNIVSMVSQRDKAPTNALIAHSVRACASRGIRYLVYSNFAYGKKERSTLSDFKEGNGFQKIDVPRYYVPLTLMSEAALGLGLHRGVTHFVPEPILERLREFRKSWYSRKFQSEAKLESSVSS
ncbi:MAG: hypothetical protein ABSA96_08940 [Candidatus Acidiferrales bacterium]|jgi:hypothetical protein